MVFEGDNRKSALMAISNPVRNLRDNTANSFQGRIPKKTKPSELLSKEAFSQVQPSTQRQYTVAVVQEA